MFLSRLAKTICLSFAAVCVLGPLANCGARTGLRDNRDAAADAGVDAPDVFSGCVTDDECPSEDLCAPAHCVEGRCVPGSPIECDDNDECTEDSCLPETGECDFRDLALDQDMDGFKGPRPGFKAGESGACGDDCDDTSDKAFPGGMEICDGVDNDCNGVVDDNATFVPSGADAIRVSGQMQKEAGGGGLAWNGSLYAATYTARQTRWRDYVKGLGRLGQTVFDETPVTNVANDSFTGPTVWTGQIFGTAWEDRRDNDYEIYFNRLDAMGEKLGPDIRVTNANQFSLHPSVLWNGSEFVLAWDDERDGGDQRIYAQRISVDGSLIGDNMQISNPGWGAESPWLAKGDRTLAVTFNLGPEGQKIVGFLSMQPNLTGVSELVVVSPDNGVSPRMVWTGDRYIVVYGKRGVIPGDAIYGAALDEQGKILVPETQLTSGASFARSQTVLSLGDRMILIWADDHDGNYELYSKMLTPDLTELTPRQRITVDPSDSVEPIAAFGPEGDVGILFSDRRSNSWQTYFTRLECSAGAAP